MTKRRDMRAPSGELQGNDGAVTLIILSLAAAILWALAIDVGVDAGVSARAHIGNLTASLSQRVRESVETLPRLPLVLAPIASADWSGMFSAEGTRKKSSPAIAIVLDDLGSNEAQSKAALALPAEITLAFLPYPKATPDLSHRAHLLGHEVIVHLPMEPMGKANPGPMALKTGMAPAELARTVDWSLSRVKDFDGVNNHMGSRFTTSYEALAPIMKVLAGRRLFFLDSRTTPETKAEAAAREAGILTSRRDVFLDDENKASAVTRQLQSVEKIALAKGAAIAIGHPHPETITALRRWMDGLEARGFRLVPLKTALELRAGRSSTVAFSQLIPRRPR